MTKRIRLSDHARRQLGERGLAEEAVAGVAESPEQVLVAGARRIAQSRFGEGADQYLLRVVCEEAEETITVVTAYRTSKVSKYWSTA